MELKIPKSVTYYIYKETALDLSHLEGQTINNQNNHLPWRDLERKFKSTNSLKKFIHCFLLCAIYMINHAIQFYQSKSKVLLVPLSLLL